MILILGCGDLSLYLYTYEKLSILQFDHQKMPQENKSVTMHSASYPLSDVLRTLTGLVYSTKKENGGASGRFERYLDNPINMRYFF